MSEHFLGSLPPDQPNGEVILIDVRGLDPAQRSIVPPAANDDTALLQTERLQLAQDIADIERAAAALRKAEPTLESWIKPASASNPKPRPLWLLIGVLWLSTALVTVGAVVAIASFAG